MYIKICTHLVCTNFKIVCKFFNVDQIAFKEHRTAVDSILGVNLNYFLLEYIVDLMDFGPTFWSNEHQNCPMHIKICTHKS